MTDDQVFSSWAEWITRTSQELTHIYSDRDVFLHIQLMFDTNPAMSPLDDPDSYSESAHHVLSWLARLYGHEALMFIRREFDTQPGTINLLKLFSEMEARPQILTRKRYRSMYDALSVPESVKDDLANDHFDSFKRIVGATPADDYIDPVQVAEDRKALDSQIEIVREFANRNLAHRTAQWDAPAINVPDDLDGPLDAICKTFNRYYPLLTGKSMPDPMPHITFFWQECMTHPLATDAYFEAKKNGLEKARRDISRAVLERIKSRGGAPT